MCSKLITESPTDNKNNADYFLTAPFLLNEAELLEKFSYY